MNTKKLDSLYVANTYARFPLEIVSGSGSLVYDETGKEYIDMGTGIAVNTFGVSDPVWVAAVTEQLAKFQHTSNLYYSAPCAQLAEKLCTRTGMKKVFFSNSGAEANECLIKAARKYSADRYGADRYNIITLVNSFHGRTLTTLAATGQDAFHVDFLPLTDGFRYAPAGDMAAVRDLCKDGKVCAVLVEAVQGEGGVMPLEKAFVSDLAAFCQENDVLLLADEVQCGNGRTGMLYGYMNYGVVPDGFTTAKGLGGGLPIGASVLGEKLENIFTPGLNGSTFGGNPVSCAGALSVFDRLDDALLADVRDKSEYIVSKLTGAKGVLGVSGLGLMLGVTTVADASAVIARCMEMGVLPIKAKNKLRLLPALNIPWDVLKKAVAVIKTACAELSE